ncbi:MFS transporter [Ktedonospora formicarum]|uniref:MFS transporter n=1 Tax=Ktedonospora formicarum TaxID=2778364 RepID=A0A8J3I533_9CHLR|nr:MFS transporter [Ktedonospora formicarum]GHO50462.1 MFS transporter [Ktedonospora formicarum]
MNTHSSSAVSSSNWAIRVLPLALGMFAIGSEGLVIAGILPDVARGLNVSISAAGQLVTIFALAYALLGPFLTALATRFPIRRVLLGALIIFAVGNVLAALAPSYGLMVVIRILAAIGAASFQGVASAAGVALAPLDKQGRALALVWSGLTVALVAGVPLGTFIAGLASWRITFAVVAALAALAALGIVVLVPELARPPIVTVPMFGRLMRRSALLAILVTTLFAIAGEFVAYTYIAPLVTLLTPGSEPFLALILLGFGIAGVIGNALGGTSADRFGANRTIVVSLVFLLGAMLLLWGLNFVAVSVVTIILAALAATVWGVTGWSFVTPLQSQLLTTAPEQVSVTLALNNSALNLGTALGGAVGGLIVSSHVGFLPLSGSIFIALGLLLHQLVVGHRRPSLSPSASFRTTSVTPEGEKIEQPGR